MVVGGEFASRRTAGADAGWRRLPPARSSPHGQRPDRQAHQRLGYTRSEGDAPRAGRRPFGGQGRVTPHAHARPSPGNHDPAERHAQPRPPARGQVRVIARLLVKSRPGSAAPLTRRPGRGRQVHGRDPVARKCGPGGGEAWRARFGRAGVVSALPMPARIGHGGATRAGRVSNGLTNSCRKPKLQRDPPGRGLQVSCETRGIDRAASPQER